MILEHSSGALKIWKQNYSDGCSVNHFLYLSQLPCHYCGTDPKSECRGFRYNGLDRIDSLRDHSPDNIVPCCRPCNFMKGRMQYDEFLRKVSAIHNRIPTLNDPSSYLVPNSFEAIEIKYVSPTVSNLSSDSNVRYVSRHSSPFLEGWLELQRNTGLSEIKASKAQRLLNDNIDAPILREVLKTLKSYVSADVGSKAFILGRHLREFSDKQFADKVLRRIPNNKHGHKWYVEVVACRFGGQSGTEA